MTKTIIYNCNLCTYKIEETKVGKFEIEFYNNIYSQEYHLCDKCSKKIMGMLEHRNIQ